MDTLSVDAENRNLSILTDNNKIKAIRIQVACNPTLNQIFVLYSFTIKFVITTIKKRNKYVQ